MKNKCQIEKKTFFEKETLLVTSNFNFSHNVFHSYYISLVYQNVALCGDGFNIFSSAVFGENPKYCCSLGIIVVVGGQKLTFCNISVITEEYVFTIKRETHTIKGDNSKCIFSDLCPFPLRLFIPYQAPLQLSIGTCMLCSCLWTNNDLKLTAFFF